MALLSSQGVDVLELKHAWRINGVVDIWKENYMTFEIPINKYERFSSEQDSIDYALTVFKNYEKRAAFKPTATGRMSYQEFKNRKNQQKPESEYLHWEQSTKTSGDDLYFIANEVSEVKIGRSNNPHKRMKVLQTGSATGLKMLFIAKGKGCMENIMHKCFSDIALSGEWFQHTERIDRFIDYAKAYKSKEPIIKDDTYLPIPKFQTPRQSHQLEANSLMPFGKFKGTKVCDLPLNYLKWFYEQDKDSPLDNYIEENLDRILAGEEKVKKISERDVRHILAAMKK